METEQIERLIKISKENPLLPEKFIPWGEPPAEQDFFLPEKLTSLQGLDIYNTLSAQQKLDLGRHELVQVMYSYGWSEGLFCLFMNKYILTLPPTAIEYKFLIRELIEEFRHQEMFAMAVQHLKGNPIMPGKIHKLFGLFTAKYLPADFVFMSALSIELITDIYGNHFRKEKNIYKVVQKISELHHIEEARHILFTEDLLKQYTGKAGFIKKSVYSIIVLLNIYFMRTLYVKKEIYKRVGIENPDKVYKVAYKNYKQKFAQECLDSVIAFVKTFDGFNFVTRPLWKVIIGVDTTRLA